MISLPLLQRLDVMHYGMYPGRHNDGLKMDLQPGLTLVIGANGLGKTTLITILYRLLTGPFDVPGLERGRELGTANLKEAPLQRDRRLILAQRVADNAREASGRVEFLVGESTIILERSLHDLSLRFLSIDGQAINAANEADFQSNIIKLVGVWSFGDWILILQHLLFYFESRRELVWDPSAQRELLRALFLPVDTAQKWAQDARAILEMDSYVRNLSAVRSRLETTIAAHGKQLETLPEIRAELQMLEKLQSVDREQRESLNEEIDGADAMRQSARQRQMSLAQDREERYRDLEREKLIAITAQFPTQSETARYIIAQLMTEGTCLVCGTKATKAARLLEERVARAACVVCASPITMRKSTRVSRAQVNHLIEAFDQSEAELADAVRALGEAEKHYAAVSSEIGRLNVSITERAHNMDALIAKLPPEEAALHAKRSDLAGFKALEDEQRAELAQKRGAFKVFIDEQNSQIAKWADDVKRAFHDFAQGFLVEDCSLVWQPQRAKLGQYGDVFEFPGFELSMTGADFSTPTRRSGPEQVSESQREFIDLAFRMALVIVASRNGSGTLIIDAPESSLDTVFASRAAEVLLRFANINENRLIVTSNLVEGDLMPRLARSIPRGKRKKRIVDLFEIAKKTAAVQQYWPDYERARERLLQ